MKKPSWLDKIANGLGYIKAVSLSTLGSLNLPAWPFHKTQDYIEAYKSWVFACAEARATDISRVKFHLYKTINRKTGEVEEVFDHEALSLLRSVNPFMTHRELFEATQAYKDLAGEAFWYLARGGSGEKSKIVQIWVLRPDWVSIQTDKEDFIKGYEYRIPGQEKISINKEDIVHFKRFNPIDPYRGMSIIRAAATTIDVDTNAEEYNRRFYINSALPQVVLKTEQKLDPKIAERMKSQWNSEFGGVSKAHKLAILEAGLEIQPYAVTQKDMEFLEGQKFTRDKIMAMFKVPKTVLGMTEGVTVSNAEITDYVFAKRVVDPEQEKLMEVLTEFLLPHYKDGADMFFKHESPVPENTTAKLEKHKTLFAIGAMTQNEIRKENNMDEVDGLDSFYVPINLQRVTDENNEGDEKEVKFRKRKLNMAVPPMRLKEKVAKEISEKITDEVAKAIHKNIKTGSIEENLKPSTLSQDTQEAIWKQFVYKSESFESKYLAEVRSYFKRQEKETLERLESVTKALSPKDANKVLFNLTDENKVGADIFVPILMSFLEEAGEDALESLGLDAKTFDTTEATIQEFKKEGALKGIKEINKVTKLKLRKVLSAGVAGGLSIPEIAKQIQQVFQEADKVRAIRIARTEVLRAGNRGALEAYKQSGVVAGKQWFTAIDERVCEFCGPLHGKIKALNNKFFHEGESFTGKEGGVIHLDYSDVGEPPLHPNCRCTLIPIIRS